MILLVLSLALVALAPLVYELCRGRAALPAALDGFVLVVIGGIVLLHLLPEAVASGGGIVLVVAALGLVGPTVGERLLHHSVHRTHAAALGLVIVGIGLHSILDGTALAAPELDPSGLLPYAVLLHRFPVALALWWLLRPSYGAGFATAVLLVDGTCTVIGYGLGEVAGAWLTGGAAAVFQALIAGSLLHVVFHRRPSRETVEGVQRWEGAGALVGLLLLGLLLFAGGAGADEPHASRTLETFLALALASAPALLLAYLGAGLLGAFLPRSSVLWMRRGSTWSQALRGMLVGLPLPMCSCGVVPLYRSLIGRGASGAAALAFLVATPELGLDAVLITVSLLGTDMAVARVAAAAAVAWLVGSLVGRMREVREAGAFSIPIDTPDEPAGRRLRAGMRMGLGEIVDQTAPWILLGLVASALLEPLIGVLHLESLPWVVQVPAFALVGLPLYVCASGATPFAAVLIAGGVSPGAALAFLLTGPATNITTVGLLGRLHGRRLALAFAAACFGLAVAAGWLVDALLPGLGGSARTLPQAETAGALEWTALALLAALYAASLLRLGARRFLVENLLAERPAEAARADACSA